MRGRTCPLLVWLVDRIECILDGDTLEVSCCDLKPEREVEINLLDRRCCEELLQDILLVNGGRRGVDLPEQHGYISDAVVQDGMACVALPARLLGLLGNLKLDALGLWG